MTTSSPLSNDQRAAAEAAFCGRPLNPNWTRQAQAIYRGIWAVKHGSNSLQNISSPARTTPVPTIPLRTPLLARPVQAWHIRFMDHSEDHIMLFPLTDTIDDLLRSVHRLHPTRPFEMQPLKSGQFHIPHHTRSEIEQTCAQDARRINHLGQVFLCRSSDPSP